MKIKHQEIDHITAPSINNYLFPKLVLVDLVDRAFSFRVCLVVFRVFSTIINNNKEKIINGNLC